MTPTIIIIFLITFIISIVILASIFTIVLIKNIKKNDEELAKWFDKIDNK